MMWDVAGFVRHRIIVRATKLFRSIEPNLRIIIVWITGNRTVFVPIRKSVITTTTIRIREDTTTNELDILKRAKYLCIRIPIQHNTNSPMLLPSMVRYMVSGNF